MQTTRIMGLILCFMLCRSTMGQESSASEPESLEVQAVLFGDCVKQHKPEPQDAEAIHIVYVRIQRVGDKASVQYREFDDSCKTAFTRSGAWTSEQFENAKEKLRKAGMRDGRTIAPPESSGSDVPISFLKIRAPELNADIYTMYLRSRWAGTMDTENSDAARVIEVWRMLLKEISNSVAMGPTEEVSMAQIASDCAKNWPQSLQFWLWTEAQRAVSPPQRNQKCFASQTEGRK